MRRVLFRLKRGDRRFDVEHWRDYGVVCPDLVTTNGSAKFLADFVWSHVQAGRYEIEPVQEMGAPDARSEVALRDWLVEAASR